MLDGLLLHGSGLEIHEHYVDTGGATDHVFALSHLLGYLARRFDRRTQAELTTLADRLKTVLRSRILASGWMSPQAKAEALQKLDAYRVEVGVPEHGDGSDGLLIRPGDLYGDVERATARAWADDRARLDRPVDRDRWAMTTQTVNAYNSAPLRQVVFSAALLQPPAFDPSEDAALQYGGMGAIIGHELTHAFDDEGRRFDHTGRLRGWWTAADKARFSALTERLVARFSACEALPGLHVDGRLTLGENLADMGGLQLAFTAYHASLQGRPAPVIGGFTGDQRFFLGFALLRRGVRRPDAVRTDVRTDPHTPDRCRVNEDVREVPGWYDAFHVRKGQHLALAPEEITRIW